MKLKYLKTYLIAFALATGSVVFAQSFGRVINENPLQIVAVTLSKAEIPAGANAEVTIDVELADDHHAYLDQFKILPSQPKNMKISVPDVSPVQDFNDSISGKIKKGIGEGRAVLKAVFEIPEGARGGLQELKFLVQYQACTDEYCLLPIKLPAVAEATVVSDNMPFQLSNIRSFSDIEALLGRNILLAFLLVFLAGILTSFTPCIFPMVPITLAVLGTRSEQHSKLSRFGLALSYVLGIAITYSILGLVAASTGALFGGFLGHPAVGIGFGIAFIFLALGMYGVYELQAPGFVRTRLGLHKTKGGPIGAFLAGQVSGVLASPCVGPVLVAILAFVAKTQDLTLGFFLLFTFAFGMGQIFLLLGTFSHLITKLPKAGPWMNFTKFVMGTAMVGLALFYMNPVISERVFDALLGIALVLIASGFGAFEPNEKLEIRGRLTKGIMWAVLLLGIFHIALAIVPGIKNLNTNDPQGLSSSQSEASSAVAWQSYSETSLNQALSNGQPVIIDFYADWCVACKELEVYTFTEPPVQEIKNQFTWLKFDATKSSPEFDKLKAKYGIIGLPWIVFYDHTGKYRTDLTLTGFEKAPAFRKRMDEAL